MNRCLSEARADYVALLNNDIELDAGFSRRWSELEAHPEARLGGRQDASTSTDRDVIDGAGDSCSGPPRAGGAGTASATAGRSTAPSRCFCACGGAALYRRAALTTWGRSTAT